MEIKEGSSVTETIDSLLAADTNFGYIEDDAPIILVEGKDDKELIDRYYYHRNGESNPFRVAVGEDFDEKVNGKKMALRSFHKIKNKYSRVFMLVDRDFDFFVGENLSSTDSDIFYYDYYELENYLFEDAILKLYFDRYFDCVDEAQFEKLKRELKKVICILEPFSQLSFIRELIYRDRLNIELEEEHKIHIASIAAKNPSGVLQNKSNSYIGLRSKEKVEKYIDFELDKIGLNLDCLIDSMSGEEVASDLANYEDPVYFFKFLISGKSIINSLNIIIEHIDEITVIPKRSNGVLAETVKKEWIPLYSESYSNLLNKIQSRI